MGSQSVIDRDPRTLTYSVPVLEMSQNVSTNITRQCSLGGQ